MFVCIWGVPLGMFAGPGDRLGLPSSNKKSLLACGCDVVLGIRMTVHAFGDAAWYSVLFIADTEYGRV